MKKKIAVEKKEKAAKPPKVKKYTIYWLDGTKQILEGEEAYKQAGIEGRKNERGIGMVLEREDHSFVWRKGGWHRKE